MRLEAEQVTKQYQTDPKKHGLLMPFLEPIWWWRAENLPSLQENREAENPRSSISLQGCFSRHRAACWREEKICTAWRTVNCQSSEMKI